MADPDVDKREQLDQLRPWILDNETLYAVTTVREPGLDLSGSPTSGSSSMTRQCSVRRSRWSASRTTRSPQFRASTKGAGCS
jgi:hypothetical protein